MRSLIARFAQDRSGDTAIEYGLIASLIGLAIIVGASALGNTIDTAFSDITARVQVK